MWITCAARARAAKAVAGREAKRKRHVVMSDNGCLLRVVVQGESAVADRVLLTPLLAGAGCRNRGLSK